MEISELSKILKDNGVVGSGGAGFPTYAKLDKRAETIIMNCAECEPLLKLHRQLLEQYSDEIVKTFNLIGETVGAKEMIIGIKKAYKKTIAALTESIKGYDKVRLGLLDEVYPAGDEVVLIYEVTKKVVKPGGLPIESGVAVFNVETVYNLYVAMEKKQPVTSKVVSVVGEVNNPVTVRVPVGTSLDELVSLAGGCTVSEPVYFVGGPMMGNIGNGPQPVTKTTNAVIVLPEDHFLVKKKLSKTTINLKRAAASCCQCRMCTDLCPRHALGHPIEPHKFMRAAFMKDAQDTNMLINTFFCSSCGLCEMYSCNQGLSPRSLIAEYKLGMRAAGLTPPKGIVPSPVEESRELRKVPMKRLMARLDLTKYDKDAPLCNDEVVVKKVKISLSQHIGAPAVLFVKVGDRVQKGDIIGNAANGLSVNIHASISGKVTMADAKCVVIEA